MSSLVPSVEIRIGYSNLAAYPAFLKSFIIPEYAVVLKLLKSMSADCQFTLEQSALGYVTQNAPLYSVGTPIDSIVVFTV